MEIKIKKLHPDATIPVQSTDLSGGWDVTATMIEQVAPDFVICKLGFAVQLPKGYKMTIVPRSSLTGTEWVLQNSPGLIDADYTGEVQLRFRALPIGITNHGTHYNLKYPEFPYGTGQRIGQIYLESVIPMEFDEVLKLDKTERGSGGYGSTGV